MTEITTLEGEIDDLEKLIYQYREVIIPANKAVAAIGPAIGPKVSAAFAYILAINKGSPLSSSMFCFFVATLINAIIGGIALNTKAIAVIIPSQEVEPVNKVIKPPPAVEIELAILVQLPEDWAPKETS